MNSLDNEGVDRQTYERQNCGNIRRHDQHLHSPIGGLTLNCPGVMTPEIRTALARWEAVVTNAHGGNARKAPLLTAAQLIEAGDKLAEILRRQEEKKG